jgi:NADPH2:quinone reductase
MVHAIRFHQPGGPEVMKWEEVEVGEPGPGQVRLRQTAVWLNFIDVYHRTGLYPVPSLPGTPGMEAAGVVEAIGPNVTELQVGDRVAYAAPPVGAYAEARLMPADRLVPLPSWIDDRQAAAMMLQGMTAQYLLRSTYRVQPGETILVHAAAGGVGLILCQWARKLGVTVIGTVGSDEKAELAREHGCTHPIVYTRENFTERVRELTNGEGVPVVYDSVGKDTFMGSLDSLRPRGLLVLFGQSSGSVPPFDLGLLASKGSLYITRPTLFVYTAKRDDLMSCAADLFEVVHSGDVKINVNQTFPLRDAAEAHRAMEGRRTTGSSVLLP